MVFQLKCPTKIRFLLVAVPVKRLTNQCSKVLIKIDWKIMDASNLQNSSNATSCMNFLSGGTSSVDLGNSWFELQYLATANNTSCLFQYFEGLERAHFLVTPIVIKVENIARSLKS